MMNTKTQDRVVVMVAAQMFHNFETGTSSARVKPMGVTAYGDTQDEAYHKVKRMVASVVRAHRTCGDLGKWLDTSGVKWWWESDYEGPLPVEDISGIEKEHRPRISGALNHPDGGSKWVEIGQPMPLAA